MKSRVLEPFHLLIFLCLLFLITQKTHSQGESSCLNWIRFSFFANQISLKCVNKAMLSQCKNGTNAISVGKQIPVILLLLLFCLFFTLFSLLDHLSFSIDKTVNSEEWSENCTSAPSIDLSILLSTYCLRTFLNMSFLCDTDWTAENWTEMENEILR